MVLRGKYFCLQTTLSNKLRYSLQVHTSFLMRQKRKPWLMPSLQLQTPLKQWRAKMLPLFMLESLIGLAMA